MSQFPYSTKVLLARLIKEHVGSLVPTLCMAVLCMALSAGSTGLNAWIMQPALDEIFLKKKADMLAVIPLLVLVVAAIKGAASYGENVLMRYVGQRIITDMQIRLYRHLLYADLALHSRHSTGRLISRFTNDINLMRMSVSVAITGIGRESLTVICLVGVMLYQSPMLSLIALVVFPVAVLPILRLGRRMRKISAKTQEELGNFTSRLDESFQALRVIKAYGREEFEISRANGVMEGLFALYMKAIRLQALSSPIMEMLGGVAVAAVIWYGGREVIAGTTTPGAFFSFIAALIMGYRPMKVLSGLNNNVQEGMAAAARLFEILDSNPEIVDKPGAGALQVRRGEISFKDVVFHYPTGHAALSGVSINIPAGKTVALVGHSGSGKTTVMNLLLRFYEPQSGVITVDGQDIKGVTAVSLRRRIALVSQEVFLFDDTVAANIAYGREGAGDDEIKAAAIAASADGFISAMNEGYAAMVGQHGMKLSGGQRQRISIARAILRNAPILLLDEATSSLDPVAEREIQEALAKLSKGRTTLIIAHRLSTVRSADLIYVMDKGRVAATGTHEELLAGCKEYQDLFGKEIV